MLRLCHPELPRCDDCQQWLFDPADGWRLARNLATGEPVRRPSGSSPPCDVCPKCAGLSECSPAAGRRCDLSAKNERTIELYYQVQATHGRSLSGGAARDSVLAQNLGAIAVVLEEFERQECGRLKKALRKLATAVSHGIQ